MVLLYILCSLCLFLIHSSCVVYPVYSDFTTTTKLTNTQVRTKNKQRIREKSLYTQHKEQGKAEKKRERRKTVTSTKTKDTKYGEQHGRVSIWREAVPSSLPSLVRLVHPDLGVPRLVVYHIRNAKQRVLVLAPQQQYMYHESLHQSWSVHYSTKKT